MTLVADTSGILAAIDVRHDTHQRCLDAIVDADAVLVSPMVLAEVDYMITTRFGLKAALGFLDDVLAGVYEVAGVGCKLLDDLGFVGRLSAGARSRTGAYSYLVDPWTTCQRLITPADPPLQDRPRGKPGLYYDIRCRYG